MEPDLVWAYMILMMKGQSCYITLIIILLGKISFNQFPWIQQGAALLFHGGSRGWGENLHFFFLFTPSKVVGSLCVIVLRSDHLISTSRSVYLCNLLQFSFPSLYHYILTCLSLPSLFPGSLCTCHPLGIKLSPPASLPCFLSPPYLYLHCRPFSSILFRFSHTWFFADLSHVLPSIQS